MWLSPQPHAGWGEVEQTNLLREVWARVVFSTFQWTPPSINANTTTGFTFGSTVSADINNPAARLFRVGMGITLNPPASLPYGLAINALVLQTGQMHIDIMNVTGAPVTPPSGTWTFWGVIT